MMTYLKENLIKNTKILKYFLKKDKENKMYPQSIMI